MSVFTCFQSHRKERQFSFLESGGIPLEENEPLPSDLVVYKERHYKGAGVSVLQVGAVVTHGELDGEFLEVPEPLM